ncbi:hypothetical protein Tco_1167224 [Tanacetum coccineum]
MLKDSIDNGPYQLKPEITVKDRDGVTDIRRPQRVEDLAGQENLRYNSDIKAVNILLLGLPVDIYALINHYQTAKEIWDFVKELMEGTKMTKQERESMLYDEFNKFTSEPGESIHSYYLRYAKLINDMKMIPMSMSNMQINIKFLQAIANFKADHVDAYDSNYDDKATANAIFMENLSPVGSINDDTVEPRYDSDILSKVPHYDTYHDSDMLNSNIQQLGYIKNIVSNSESYDELTSNSNVISYTDYMLTIGNDADNYVPFLVQKNDMILFVIEQMKTQVEKCNMETLILAEESQLKMIEKQTKINAKPIDYLKLNKLYAYFVPQKQLSAEQLYWSSTLSPPESVSKPTKVFPKKLPSASQVLKNLNNVRDLLRAFKKDVIPFSENLKETFKLFEKGFIAEVKEMKDIFEQMGQGIMFSCDLKKMAPKRKTTRLNPDATPTPVTDTHTTTSVTNAQIQEMINEGVTAALAARDATKNGDDSHTSGTGARRPVQVARECTYPDFLKCQPLNFKGTEGVVKFATYTLQGNALTWWNSHVKTTTPEAAHAMPWRTLKKMMTDKYCPRGEIKKLEFEM